MLTLSNVMQTTGSYFDDHVEERKLQVIKDRYETIESSIIWLRKQLESKGYEITLTVKNTNLTVIHTLYGYEKIEQFLKGHEQDLKHMEVLRNFMSDELNKPGEVA